MIYNRQNIKYEENSDATKKIAHDFRNHITCIRELIRKSEYSRALSYIDDIAKTYDTGLLPFGGSGNVVIDGLLKEKYSMACQYDITIDAILEIPSTFCFSDADISVILGNSLDNAIEALKNSSIKNRRIMLEICLRQRNLMICVKNEYEGTIRKNSEGNFITSKSDKKNHGIGLTSIKNAVEKYDGIMEINTKGKVFELNILLYAM